MQSIATPSLITAACNLLNNLIFIGLHEVVRQIYEHSIDKYLFGYVHGKKSIKHYNYLSTTELFYFLYFKMFE